MTFTVIMAAVLICCVETISGQCETLTSQRTADRWRQIAPAVDEKINKIIYLNNITKNMQYMFDKSFTYGGNKYLWSRHFSTDFHLASLACVHYGGRLPEIKNKEELAAVKSFVGSNAFLPCAYIGMNKLADGRWYYTRSRTPAFTSFGPNAEDPTSKCGSLWSEVKWEMDDVNCEGQFCHVFCQIPI